MDNKRKDKSKVVHMLNEAPRHEVILRLRYSATYS
jgi:hypothetical protein